MTLDERYRLVLEGLAQLYPNADTELIYHDPAGSCRYGS